MRELMPVNTAFPRKITFIPPVFIESTKNLFLNSNVIEISIYLSSNIAHGVKRCAGRTYVESTMFTC